MEKYYVWKCESLETPFSDERNFVEAEGAMGIVLSGFEKNDFFVVKEKSSSLLPMTKGSIWSVYEARTGFLIDNGFTRTQAIENAVKKLKEKGVRLLRRKIKEKIQQYGESPRYKKF